MQRKYSSSGARRKFRRGEGASSHKLQAVGQSQLANRYPLTAARYSPSTIRYWKLGYDLGRERASLETGHSGAAKHPAKLHGKLLRKLSR